MARSEGQELHQLRCPPGTPRAGRERLAVYRYSELAQEPDMHVHRRTLLLISWEGGPGHAYRWCSAARSRLRNPRIVISGMPTLQANVRITGSRSRRIGLAIWAWTMV